MNSLRTEVKMEMDREDHIVETFTQTLGIVNKNTISRLSFVSKYNEWSKQFEAVFNTLAKSKENFMLSISPNRYLRFIVTSIITLCLLESIRCKNTTCCLTGLAFFTFVISWNFLTTVIVDIYKQDKSIDSITFYINSLANLCEIMKNKLNRTRQIFKIISGPNILHSIPGCYKSTKSFKFNNLLHSWVQLCLSWYDVFGILFAVQISVVLYVLEFSDFPKVLQCLSGMGMFLLVLLQYKKINRYRGKMQQTRQLLDSITSAYFHWFEKKCLLRTLLMRSGYLDINVPVCFHYRFSIFKNITGQYHLMSVLIAVGVTYGLQYGIREKFLSDAVRYFLFDKRPKQNITEKQKIGIEEKSVHPANFKEELNMWNYLLDKFTKFITALRIKSSLPAIVPKEDNFTNHDKVSSNKAGIAPVDLSNSIELEEDKSTTESENETEGNSLDPLTNPGFQEPNNEKDLQSDTTAQLKDESKPEKETSDETQDIHNQKLSSAVDGLQQDTVSSVYETDVLSNSSKLEKGKSATKLEEGKSKTENETEENNLDPLTNPGFQEHNNEKDLQSDTTADLKDESIPEKETSDETQDIHNQKLSSAVDVLQQDTVSSVYETDVLSNSSELEEEKSTTESEDETKPNNLDSFTYPGFLESSNEKYLQSVAELKDESKLEKKASDENQDIHKQKLPSALDDLQQDTTSCIHKPDISLQQKDSVLLSVDLPSLSNDTKSSPYQTARTADNTNLIVTDANTESCHFVWNRCLTTEMHPNQTEDSPNNFKLNSAFEKVDSCCETRIQRATSEDYAIRVENVINSPTLNYTVGSHKCCEYIINRFQHAHSSQNRGEISSDNPELTNVVENRECCPFIWNHCQTVESYLNQIRNAEDNGKLNTAEHNFSMNVTNNSDDDDDHTPSVMSEEIDRCGLPEHSEKKIPSVLDYKKGDCRNMQYIKDENVFQNSIQNQLTVSMPFDEKVEHNTMHDNDIVSNKNDQHLVQESNNIDKKKKKFRKREGKTSEY